MNKSTFTAQLRIEAIVAEAQKELTNFGNSLKKAWQGGEPPKNLLRTYEEMRVRLESLKQISEKGLIDTSDLRQAENDFKVFQKDIHNLAVEFKLMSVEQKRAMLSTEEQAAMKARTAAVKEYTDAIKKNQDIVKQRKPLEEQRATTLKKQEPARSKAQATLDISGPALKAIEERGALLSKEAQIYKNNTEWAKKYEDQIKRLQSKPNKTESDNKSIAKKQAELDALDLKTGKEQYDREMALHETEVQKLRDAVNAAKQEMEEMDSVVDKLDRQLAKLNPVDETKQLEKLKERLKELGVEGIDDAKDIDTLRKAIQQLDNKAFARVEQSLQDMNAGLGAMGAEALQVGRQLDATTDAIKRQEEALRNQEAFEGKIKQFLGMTGAVELLRRAMTSAFTTIKELDAAMTEMAVVTDIDISGYWDQLPEYTARANELGLTIKDVYQADTLFYQQGLKTNEVVELSTQTMRMARVAGLDTAEATDRMTAALRGFNMELNEANAQKIADVYSELAAITASDVDEISSAMTKTASIAASAGMEFETTAAFLSQIIETTRESAETAGTALKTVIARFQELKKDPSEIGEVEGEIVDANKIETALRSVGVALRDSSGQFRDLDDVFLELSQKWDTLDKNTQRYIATIAAGSRQQSRFIAMMSDYGRTQELVSAATNSAGANQEQFEKTMDSIRTKLNKLKNAWDEFSMSILESDLVKTGVDILTTFLKVINKATNAFDGLGGSIMKIVTVIGMFNVAKKIFAKIKQPIIDVFSEIVTEAYKKGEEAARAYADGARAGAEKQPEAPTHNDEAEEPEKKKLKDRAGEKIKDITGITKMGAVDRRNKALDALKEYEASGFNLEEKKALQAKKKKHGWKKDGSESAAKGAENSRKEYEKLTKEIEDYEKTTKEANKTAKQAWKEAGEGAAQMGATIAGVGIGVSMLGGALEEMGVEGTEWLTSLGNGLAMAGSAMSALGPTITNIVGKLVAGGASTAVAWAWVAAAAATIVTIVIAITEVARIAEAASPEKKLEKAKTAADDAAEAANEATRAYEGMRDALEDIEDQQKTLKGLARNTDAWKTAVAKLNSEILSLIQQYPQLARFVEHEDGVMSIDFEDAGVQATLDQAQKLANEAQLISTGAQIDLLATQDAAAYDRLDKKAKIEYRDPEAAARGAAAHTYTANMLVGGGAGAGIGAGIGGLAGAAGSAGVFGIPAAGVGAIIGALIGLAGGGLTTFFSGEAEYFAKEAEENADAFNDKTQSTVEGIAQALASGKIIDTGSGYELAQGVTNADLEVEYRAGIETMNEFYGGLSDATAELKEFGTALNETSATEKAYYDSMAVQIYNSVDKSGWDSGTQAIGDNLISGERIQAERKDILGQLKDKDMLDKNLDDETKNRLSTSLQKAYGAGAQLVEDTVNGGYKIIDAQGGTKRTGVTSEDLKNIVATQEATGTVETIAEMMPQIKTAVVSEFQHSEALKGYEAADIEKAVITAFDSDGGEDLTQEQVEMLSKLTDGSSEELEKIYNSSSVLQKAFATSADFVVKLKTPINEAKKAFGQSADVFETLPGEVQDALDNLTSAAQFGLASDDKLGKIYSIGTQEEIEAFEKSFTTVLTNNADKAEGIASYMNTVDWSNTESLINMEYALQELYGVSAEEAHALATSMIEATNATSKLSRTTELFGGLFQVVQKLNKALADFEVYQWEYENILSRGGSTEDIATNIANQKETAYMAGQEALNAYQEARALQAETYGKGATLIEGIDLTEYLKWDVEKGIYDVTEFRSRVNTMTSEDDKKKAQDWFSELEQSQKTADDQIKIARDQYTVLQRIEDMEEEAFWDLYDMMADMATTEIQKAIDLQQEILAATESGNAQLLKQMQDQIAATRQKKKNEESRQNIQDLTSQLAYLQMGSSDTSLEQLELQEQINAAKEDHQNSLIDQSLQDIQDANAAAAEQRQRQISLAEQQLELYKNSAIFEQEVFGLVEDLRLRYIQAEQNNEFFQNTELGQRIKKALTEGMTEQERNAFWQGVSNNIGLSTGYNEDTKDNTEDVNSSEMEKLLDAIKDNTSVEANTFQQAYGLARAAHETDTNFKNATKFDIGGSAEYDKYIERDSEGNIIRYDTAGLNDYTEKVTRISQQEDTLKKLNETGRGIYDNAPHELLKDQAEEPFLSEEDFYDAINANQVVTVGNDFFVTHHGKIEDQLLGKTEGDFTYAAYAQAYRDFYNPVWTKAREAILTELSTNIKKDQKSSSFHGMETVQESDYYLELSEKYTKYGGKDEDFLAYAAQQITGGVARGVGNVTMGNPLAQGPGGSFSHLTKIDGKEYWFDIEKYEDGSWSRPDGSNLMMVDGQLYTLLSGPQMGTSANVQAWNKILPNYGHEPLAKKYLEKLRAYKAYKTGGLADFTGPAWLDGTKSHPELVLNQRDTANFIQLKDILAEVMNRSAFSDTKSQPSGDNYFEIEINVESIDNDYDVEQIADKIRSMIYEDATYRNVNAINNIR